MHQILLGITDEQKQSLNNIKLKTGKAVNVIIREAIDLYLKE